MRIQKHILLFAACFLTTLSSLLAQTGIVRGSVLDERGEPVPGASVLIVGKGLGAVTTPEGLFSISKVPDGDLTVRVTYIGYDTVYKKVTMEKGKTLSLSFGIQESATELEAVEITETRLGEISKTEIEVGKVEITARQINLMPSLGTPDLAQYLSVLPGVVSTGDQGGQIFIRGGTPVQNMVLMDGAIIYSPFHSIGLFSVFDPDYIRTVDLYSAAFPAQYGGRISSIMDIKTRNGDYSEIRGKVNINPITAGLQIEGPFARRKNGKPGGNSWLFSARRGYLDKTSPALYSYVNDSIGIPFNFTDIYGKVSLSDGLNAVNFFGFYNGDNVNYGYPSDYTWDMYGGGTQFRMLPANSNLILSGNFAYSSFNSGLKAVSETFPRQSSIRGFNGGLQFTYLLNTVNEFSYGITFLGFTTDYAFTNSFGLITRQQFNNTEAAGNFRYKKVFKKQIGLGPDSTMDKWVLEPGLRLHYYNDHGFVSFEPRFRTKYNLEHVSFTAGAGLYSQNLMSANSDRDVVQLFQGYLAAPEDVARQIKSHTLQTSAHLLAGVEMELLKNTSTRVEGWYKDFTQLTNVNRDKLFPDDPNFITETGTAYGVDFTLQYESKHWYLYGNYGWAKVQRDDSIRTYYTVFDRRHNVNLVAAWTSGELYAEGDKGERRFTEKKWEFSARWNVGSGFPFTQTQGFFEKIEFADNGSQTDYVTQNGSLGILYADEINAGRLPWYHRLDLSAKRRWRLGNQFLMEANASAINVYNRQNIFYFDRIKFSAVYQLPFVPTLGLTLKF